MDSNEDDSLALYGAIFFIVIILLAVQFNRNKPSPPAPPFQAADLRGNYHSLQKYSGQNLVIYVWSSQCGACVRDAPVMAQVYRDFVPKGIQILSVNLDSDCEAVKTYISENHLPYPTICNGEASAIAHKYSRAVGSGCFGGGIPFFVMVDPVGNIICSGSGAYALRAELNSMVGQ